MAAALPVARMQTALSDSPRSCEPEILRRHIGQHGRLDEVAALGGALAAGDDLGVLLDGIGDVRLDLLDRIHVNQRRSGTRLKPVGDLHRAGDLGETLLKSVIEPVLHQDAVGADARPRRMTREKYSLTLLDCGVLAIDGWK
jgi:hypothetical protein